MERTFLLVAALALAPLAAGAHAQDEDPYAPGDVARALGVMDLFASVNEDYYLVIDEAAAVASPDVTGMDLGIALDFAAHHNAIVDAVRNGPEEITGDLKQDNPELASELRALENGRFGAFFEENPFEGEFIEELPYGNMEAVLVTIYYLLYVF